MLSKRDKYLIEQAFWAARYYDTMESWLSEVISDAGNLAEERLAHNASIIKEDE